MKSAIITFCLSIVLLVATGCSAMRSLSTDVVYRYGNGFVTDKKNDVVFHYGNGFITKQLNISSDKSIKINDDLELYRLSANCFLYTAWDDMGCWGRVGSNGLVVVSEGEALLIDSPTKESQTVELAWWFDKNLDVKLTAFVPGHWHKDCVGGLEWLNRNGVKTHANVRTNQILASKKSEGAKVEFGDYFELKVGDVKVEFYYLGGGHSTDNIVAWIPSQKILFGGCLIKDAESKSIGNTEDAASLEEWLQTVEKVERKFGDVKIVVPGHGKWGGKELFRNTKNVIKSEKRN